MIQDFPNNIHKDTNVIGNYKTYIGKEQNCGTVWFRNVSAALKALEKDGIITGSDLIDCNQCSCNYSGNDPEHKKYSEYKCNVIKWKYAAGFE